MVNGRYSSVIDFNIVIVLLLSSCNISLNHNMPFAPYTFCNENSNCSWFDDTFYVYKDGQTAVNVCSFDAEIFWNPCFILRH